ncbi:hypothetical protein EMPS_08462 [Entomortierella parvispora]|uniref:Uncharacterized protein n=1 Tax=Entomortierella parvispora TaxID=205924 RepID=A0A9P3LZF0_9FUNG|nr:hypothetical protein EMPS_08462 [Entomortierella parvispora]
MVVYPRLVGVLLRGRSNWKAVAETDLFVLQHHPRQTRRPFRIITRGFPHYCVAEGEFVEQLKAELDMLTREAKEAIGGIMGFGIEAQGATTPVKITSKKISNWLKGLTGEPVYPQRGNMAGSLQENDDEENEVEVDVELEEEDEQPLVDDVDMEGYDDIGMGVENNSLGELSYSRQHSKQSQGRHLQDEDGYLSDLSTLSNESLHQMTTSSLNDKAISDRHEDMNRATATSMVPKMRVHAGPSTQRQAQHQPNGEACIPLGQQTVKSTFVVAGADGEMLISPMPRAPRPQHRSIVEDHGRHGFPFFDGEEANYMSQLEEPSGQPERTLSAPPITPHRAPPSLPMASALLHGESPISRDIGSTTYVRPRMHPHQSSLPLSSMALERHCGLEKQGLPSPIQKQLRTVGQYGIEEDNDQPLRTESSKTGGSAKTPLQRRRTCQREKDISAGSPLPIQMDSQTDEPFSSKLHSGDNGHIGVLNPRRGSHDDIHALRSILKRARSPKISSFPPLSAPVYGLSPIPGPPTRTMSSPSPALATLPSSTSLPTGLNEQSQAETQARSRNHGTSPSFMSVPLGWFTSTSQINTSYSGAGSRNRRRASDGGSVQSSGEKARVEPVDVSVSAGADAKAKNEGHPSPESPGTGIQTKTIGSRSDRRKPQTTILDLPFHIIALLTYPEPETGYSAKDAQRIIFERQERTFVRQRRRALMLLSCFILTVRYCSLDFFLVILVATNCGLLYLMKRSGQHVDVTMAKKVVHRKLNLFKSWTAGLFHQDSVKAESYSKEIVAFGLGSETMSHSQSAEDIEQNHGRRNKSSRVVTIASTTDPGLNSKPPQYMLELQLSQSQNKMKKDDVQSLVVALSRSGTPTLAPSLISPGVTLKKRRFFGKAKPGSNSSATTVAAATVTSIPMAIANDTEQNPSTPNSPVVSSSNSPGDTT